MSIWFSSQLMATKLKNMVIRCQLQLFRRGPHLYSLRATRKLQVGSNGFAFWSAAHKREEPGNNERSQSIMDSRTDFSKIAGIHASSRVLCSLKSWSLHAKDGSNHGQVSIELKQQTHPDYGWPTSRGARWHLQVIQPVHGVNKPTRYAPEGISAWPCWRYKNIRFTK